MRSHRIRLHIAAVALGALAPAAAARDYGAIAYDPGSGAWGVAWDKRTQSAANNSALSQCRAHRGQRCIIAVWFQGGCGAYAVGPRDQSAWGTGGTRSVAQRHALRTCNSGRTRCEIVAWACNSTSAGHDDDAIRRDGCESRNRYRESRGDSYRETC